MNEREASAMLRSMETMISMHKRLRAAQKVIAAARGFHSTVSHHCDKTYLEAFRVLGVALSEYDQEVKKLTPAPAVAPRDSSQDRFPQWPLSSDGWGGD